MQRELTSDDLETPIMQEGLTRKDWVRLIRSALEKNPGETIERTLKLLLQVVLEDSGFGANLRAELAQELTLASPLELVVMREALLAARTPSNAPTPAAPSGAEDEPA